MAVSVSTASAISRNIRSLVTPRSSRDGVARSLRSPSQGSCVNQLGAFINQISAQRGKKIDAALADALTAYAQRIISAVG